MARDLPEIEIEIIPPAGEMNAAVLAGLNHGKPFVMAAEWVSIEEIKRRYVGGSQTVRR